MKALAAAAIASLALMAPAPADAAPDAPHMHDGCATHPEMLHAPYGPRHSVERYLGAQGQRGSEHVYGFSRHLVAYEYPTCDPKDWLVILYRKSTGQAINFYYWIGDES